MPQDKSNKKAFEKIGDIFLDSSSKLRYLGTLTSKEQMKFPCKINAAGK